MNIAEYFPVLMFVLVAGGLGVLLLLLGVVLGPRNPYDAVCVDFFRGDGFDIDRCKYQHGGKTDFRKRGFAESDFQ